MDADTNARVLVLEQKVAFMFQILALTKKTPDGQAVSRQMGQLFEETQAHALAAQQPPTLAPNPPVPPGNGGAPPSPSGPDGFSGALTDDGTA